MCLEPYGTIDLGNLRIEYYTKGKTRKKIKEDFFFNGEMVFITKKGDKFK